ncbi:MAG: hypothetical protein FWH02_01030 [Oscillospiraceae bacterium]|nr:hypothetical protein [Oscillospiraceae bacterium]
MKKGIGLNAERIKADRKKDRSNQTNWSVGLMGAVFLLLAIMEGVINFWIAFGGCAVFLIVRLVIHLTKAKNDDPYSADKYK